MKKKIKNNSAIKTRLLQLRILVFFAFLFFNHVFSQQVKSDSLSNQTQNTSQFSKSEIIVTNGAVIYDRNNWEKISDSKLKESEPLIYVTEGTFFYAPNNSIEATIVKVSLIAKKKSVTKVLAKKPNIHRDENTVEKKPKRSTDNTKIYTPLSTDSNFSVGNIAKTIGIFHHTFSKSKKAIQFSTDCPVFNNFSKTQKRNSEYSISFYSFKNCEYYFTRPPPHFS